MRADRQALAGKSDARSSSAARCSGTTDTLARVALEGTSGKAAGRDYGLAMNPEFLREGSSIRDFNAPPFTVIGSEDERDCNAVAQLYEGIDAPVHHVSTRVAEMLKYACNAYHGLKVGFANEIGNVCKALAWIRMK
jgi:GDP-mannose 6-dehydrogenase